MSKFNQYARLAKYDEDTGIFEAIATDETIDKARERMHYETSKPHFMAWADEFSKATEGKSVGNLRSMHGKNAAGCLKAIEYNDDAHQIIVRGLVVDDNDRKKMAAGVYTGVSIGGDYAKRWDDDQNQGVKWYTAVPCEVSLVDNPCNPSARFLMHKADGSDVEVDLVGDPEAIKAREAEQLQKDAVGELAKLLDAGTVKPADLLAFAKGEITKVDEAKKQADRERLKNELCDENITQGKLRELLTEFCPEQVEKIAASDLPGMLAALFTAGGFTVEELGEIEKREFTDKQRQDAADKGQAMPDGSYPIKSKQDLKNAIQASGRAKNQAAVKRHIKRRAAALGATDMLPDNWKADEAVDLVKAISEVKVKKGLATIGWLANILQDLIYLSDQYEYEQMMEGDDAGISDRLESVCAEIGELICELAEEETQEEAEKAAVRDSLGKVLEKAGARHSAADKQRLQAIHDHAVDMGADCPGAATDKRMGAAFAKALGIEETASDERVAKAVSEVMQKAKAWDALPVRKGALRVIEKGKDVQTPVDDPGEDAEVVKLVRAAEGGDLTAHMKLIHRFGKIPKLPN